MNRFPGAAGLVFNEPLLWEKGRPGRSAFSLPRPDVPAAPLPEELTADGPDFPDLSEPELVRHYTRLSQWNFCVDSGLYPLGSCTMKYNPKINEKQAARPALAGASPWLPEDLAQGALKLMHDLERLLARITGLPAVTLQPAAGAQGELAGMLIIHACQRERREQRTKILVPDTAHGTNPASAALCGYQPVAVDSGPDGVLTLEAVASVMDDRTAGIMMTNPNTLGLFEANCRSIAHLVHERGGLVYMDGANLNAVMGIVDVAALGADILHLNLHKTFSTPHGGGGPGAGPVCVRSDLEPYLPVPRVVEENGHYRLSEDFPRSIGRLHAFHGNFGVMIKALSYILSLGPELKTVSQLAVLNANYLRKRLTGVFYLPYDRPCMHECVFTDRFQRPHKVTTLDMVKRLMDFGFHPPTVYFPLVVEGALMIEPTETESKEDLDLFIEALMEVAREAAEDPEALRHEPGLTKVRRLDETAAARKPRLCG